MAWARSLKNALTKQAFIQKEDLENIGAVQAFIQLKKQCNIKPGLNFLYAMTGALEDRYWADIGNSEKTSLLLELDGYQDLEEMTKNENHKIQTGQNIDPSNEFQKIPGVGKNLSKDFIDLGYQKINDLKGESPETMYQNLIDLRGENIDRCVLYVFRCAVYYADNTIHQPDLLKWWNWKDGSAKMKNK